MTSTGRKTKEITIGHVRDTLRKDILLLICDETGTAWVQYNDNGTKKFCMVECEQFRDWTRVNINFICKKPKENYIEPIVKLFASEARRGKKQTLYLRSASIQGDWYFSINEQECIRISKGIIEKIESPTIFRHFNHQLPYVIDLGAEIIDLNLINKFCNFTDTWELQLFKNTLPAYFVPGIAKPIQMARGPPGAAKSTINRVTKQLLDPTSTSQKGSPFPKNEGDWFVTCRKNAAPFFDNLNAISKDQQDDCCRIVTGMDIEKRKLYTDTDVIAGTIQAVLLINAIELGNLNSDFLDRAFIWELKRVEDKKRIAEEDFWREFKKVQPRILGAIFKILAKAQLIAQSLNEIPDLRLKDFAKYATACAIARGTPASVFCNQVKQKIELQKDESISQSQIIEPLKTFMENQEEWKGTAGELLKILTKQEYGQVQGSKEYERIVISNVPKEWPKNAAAFGKELARISFLFDRIGLKLQNSRIKGIRYLIFNKIKILENEGIFPGTPGTQTDLLTINEGDK